jgi:hypothetical protein
MALLKAPSIEEQVNHLLDGSMREWDYLQHNMNVETKGDCVRHLDALITRASMLRGYLDMRYGHGCGDQGHDSGVDEANKLATKVRKALGFTLPKQNIRF